MDLDLINNVIKNAKEKKFIQEFTEELKNYLKNDKVVDNGMEFQNLLSEDLTLDNTKIISKFKDKMLIERLNILREYAEKTKEKGDMYYIYNNSKDGDLYNLCCCNRGKNNKVLTEEIENLPNGTKLGDVLRNNENEFVFDEEATKYIEKQIKEMVTKNIEEQKEYLESKRIDGHIYEVGEKFSGRIWLYDLSINSEGGKVGIEEIEFPSKLYDIAKEGDRFIYKEGEYLKK